MTPRIEGDALPERAMRGGTQMVINVTRRSVAYARPTTDSRLRRLTAPVLLLPAVVILFTLAAVVFLTMLVVAMLLFAAFALFALFAHGGVRRTR
jgi:ABC-type dipeptide/oligopeptide/nickel transport system permease subunit